MPRRIFAAMSAIRRNIFTGGAKILGLPGTGGKITPAAIDKTLKGFIRGEHDPKPAAVSLTNATELGTLYSPAEISAISALIKPRGMKLHMDGARFANAVAGLGVSPAEVTWKSGVDVMSFGATKNGAMLLEAVVFFDTKLAEDFAYRRMRGGQLVSKSRYLGRADARLSRRMVCGSTMPGAPMSLAQRLAKGLLASEPDAHCRIRCRPMRSSRSCQRRLYDDLQAAGARSSSTGCRTDLGPTASGTTKSWPVSCCLLRRRTRISIASSNYLRLKRSRLNQKGASLAGERPSRSQGVAT